MKDNEQKENIKNNIDIDRLSRLCRISLSDEEKLLASSELKKMADYAYLRIKGEDTPLPFSYCHSLDKLREDIPVERDQKDTELIINSAPERCERYITVPNVMKQGDFE